jgi:hypothetical protein
MLRERDRFNFYLQKLGPEKGLSAIKNLLRIYRTAALERKKQYGCRCHYRKRYIKSALSLRYLLRRNQDV